MTRAYRWQLRGFLAAMGLLMAIQIMLLAVGVGAILRGYTRLELNRLENRARSILLGGHDTTDEPDEQFDHTGPFFVFSADLAIVYSNRGRGRSIPPEELTPVEDDGTLIGYYYAEGVQFLSSSANRFLLVSLGVLTAGSMVIALLIAMLLARRSAATIAGAIGDLRSDIETIRALEPVEARSFAISELSDASGSLHDVSVLLADEEEYKRRWMQDIAHDLRSPLSGLKGQLEGMRDGVLEPTRERLARTLDDVARMETMVASIAELHTIESATSITKEPISAGRLIDDLIAAHETALLAAGGHLESERSADYLVANRELLMRALGNIIGNAIAYGGCGVTVRLRVDEEGARTVITIANDGPSIPDEQLPRIFQRFFRGEFARGSRGSGLGLSIAQEIAVRHGGSLRAENLEPHGVRFTLELPGPQAP